MPEHLSRTTLDPEHPKGALCCLWVRVFAVVVLIIFIDTSPQSSLGKYQVAKQASTCVHFAAGAS